MEQVFTCRIPFMSLNQQRQSTVKKNGPRQLLLYMNLLLEIHMDWHICKKHAKKYANL